ncbi:hypothetical protein [Nocardioides lijunqiniae]|uniref:hypothetical protein n=1 Tax=Nocardioides lijunqiniae TaxID=2760832 RepID=UPI0018777718|nr:hypothetical protein [Nocardioides lijunqiniae]
MTTTVLGASVVSAAAPEALHGVLAGWLVGAVGLVLVALGAAVGVRAWRGSEAAIVFDRRNLQTNGLDDGLPRGVFREQQRVGLEASDGWLWWGTVAVVLGLLLGAAGVAVGRQDGQPWGVAWSLLGLVPAALCFRAGTGTTYWLTPEGVETARWPRRSVRWADVQRVVRLDRGVPQPAPGAFNVVELQTSGPVGGAPRWRGTDLLLRLALVEVDPDELLEMVQERVRDATAPR